MSLQALFERIGIKKNAVQSYSIRGINVNAAPGEKAVVENLFDALASIPSGRKALEDMAAHNTVFSLESGLKNAYASFDPQNNKIVVSESLDPASMQFNLVHEARHLWQWHQGRREAEAQNLDFASRIMLTRATEADAQTQALQACCEWEAQGNAAPKKKFMAQDTPIAAGFHKSQSLSGAFKGWYDNDLIVASYEYNYNIYPRLVYLDEEPDKRPFVSLKPADISKFCGADRVDDFETFVNSPKARQVHLMTKTAAEIYDIVSTAKGAAHDQSLENIPRTAIKGKTYARMAADMLVSRTLRHFPPSLTKHPVKRNVLKVLNSVVDNVEKLNRAEIKGITDKAAANALENDKKRVLGAVNKTPLTALIPAYFSSRGSA